MEHFIVNKKRTGRKWHVRFVFVFPEIVEIKKARDGIRTRDPNLGKVVLYQLSHCRILLCSADRNNKYYTIP